ncbi:MAG: hypothetical protein NUV56_01050 [Candidatus Uhrbacteria bacterium]|nr:hypothetical protein [Candidatus Uhrbacteria bacterium]
MPIHRAGKKFSPSHTTVIAPAAFVADVAKALPEVRKIILGAIESFPSKKQRLKLTEEPAGWKIVVYGNTCSQTLRVYSSNKPVTKKAIERAWYERGV